MKSKTLKATLAFLTAASAVVGFAGPSSAANSEGQTYSFPLQAKSDADITGNAAATVDGTDVQYTVFADNVDVDTVAMHWHVGGTCDAGGGIAISLPETTVVRNPAETVKNGFVITGTASLGTADMENVYFNIHEAGNLGNVIACGELDVGASPLLASPESASVTVGPGISINSSGVTAGGGITLEGNRLQINLTYTGNAIWDNSKNLLSLRDTPSCDASTDTYLTSGITRAVTTFGSTEAPAATDGAGGAQSLIDVYNHTFWTFTAAAGGIEDTLAINTELVLSTDEAAALRDSGFSLVLHGDESNPDVSSPPVLDGLKHNEVLPVNCAQINSGVGAGTALAGNYYGLTFNEIGSSGIAGAAYLKNTTAGTAGSVELVTDLSAANPTDTSTYFFILHDGTCDALTAPFGIGGDDPELGSVDGNTGRVRSQMVLSNNGDFSGPDRPTMLNAGEYVLVATDNLKTTAVACASMKRSFGEAPAAPPAPSDVPPFSGTVAEATTLAEIQGASDYRANAQNTGTDQEIMRLYTAFFNRDPDVAGVQYWIAVSKGEAGPVADRRVYSTLELSGFFTGSTEFQNAFESVPNDGFVDAVYQNVLGRAGEANGVAYWNDILNGTNLSGANAELKQGTRAEVVYYVAINQEFINRKPYAAPAA